MIKIIKLFIFLSILILVNLSGSQDLRAEFYKYVDQEGVVHFVDEPAKIPPQYRKDTKVYPEKYDHLSEKEKLNLLENEREKFNRKQLEQINDQQYQQRQENIEKKNNELVELPQHIEDLETQVIIKGNHVLVPAILGYEGNEVQALLLLDTGATIIALHENIADKLNIQESKVAKAQVAGGKTIHFKLVRLNYVQIGPHKMENVQAGIIKYQGPPVEHNGLLGMNFLRNFEYSIDYKNQILKWKP